MEMQQNYGNTFICPELFPVDMITRIIKQQTKTKHLHLSTGSDLVFNIQKFSFNVCNAQYIALLPIKKTDQIF